MIRQAQHDMLIERTHDEEARQQYSQTVNLMIYSTIQPGNRAVYSNRVEPSFKKTHGRAPKDRREVRAEMMREPYTQMWSAIKVGQRDYRQDVLGECIERQLPELVGRARKAASSNRKLGSLMLDPNLPIPRYIDAVDIHHTPGGYHREIVEDDVFAGAQYDRGVFLHLMSLLGEENDDIGRSQATWIKKSYPDLRPKRILDLGCTVGHSTLPYADIYPDAEVFAVDVAAPVLRYAHGRAESLGKAVHFSQQNAERTNFASASFDLVVSHILFHETANKALRRIIDECFRLLRPGGVMAHSEGPQFKDLEPMDIFFVDWDTHFQAEPFSATMHELDLPQIAVDAGFPRDKVFETFVPSLMMSKITSGYKPGVRGAGNWFVYGAQK